MKGNIIFKTAKSFIGKARRTIGKNSPTILVIAGSCGVVAGFVLAIKAGKESDSKLAEAKHELEYIKKQEPLVGETLIEEYTDGTVVDHTITKEEYRKRLIGGYARLIFACIKTYSPAILTTLFSLFLILKSHSILHGRYTTTYASLATMTKAYDMYRQNVIDAEGLEADERYRFGIKTIEEEKPLLDKEGNPKLDKNGNQKFIKERYDVIDDSELIDPRSVLWAEETVDRKTRKFDNVSADEYERFLNNRNAVLEAQESANNILRYRAKDPLNNGIGYIYLNEVRKMLGVAPIDIGNLVGWLYDPRLDVKSDRFDSKYYKEHWDEWGDNCVDFGFNDPSRSGYDGRQRFLAGKEEAVLLIMNYDGLIWDKNCRQSTVTIRRN